MALSRRLALALMGGAALSLPALGQTLGPVVREVDEAARDPSLVKARAAVIAAVKAKDFAQLAPHLDPKILISFGGANGPDALAERLKETPTLWDELDWVLTHGGRFQREEAAVTFWAPYTFTAKVGKLDVYEAGLVVADKVPARAAAAPDAAVVATLNHHAIRVVNWGDDEKAKRPFYNRTDWLQVELPGKRMAWVEARFVRAMADYRAGFGKVRGAWILTTFVAGD